MKKLIIVALVFASFGASAHTVVLKTVYTCGSHVINDVGMHTDGAKHWQVNYEIKTNGVEVYNGDGLDVPYHSINNNTIAFYRFPGFIWESNNDNDTTAYSNDDGASYHTCTEYTSRKDIN